MVEVRKRENESPGSLLRRFSKIVQQTGFLVRVRGQRYYVPPKSDYQKKREALKRLEWERETQKLRKLGKMQ